MFIAWLCKSGVARCREDVRDRVQRATRATIDRLAAQAFLEDPPVWYTRHKRGAANRWVGESLFSSPEDVETSPAAVIPEPPEVVPPSGPDAWAAWMAGHAGADPF